MKFLETVDFDWIEMLNFYERPFRAKLIPSKVWKDLDKYRNDKKGLSNYFRKWKIKLLFYPESSKAKTWKTNIGVGGAYDPSTRQSELHIYTDHYDKFQFTDKTWGKFKHRLIQVTMHEMIHFMQFDRRGDEWSNYVVPYKKVHHQKKDNERKYLSEFDEIQAYAHCVLLEFKTNRPNVPVEVLLSRSQKKIDSKTLRYFLKTFNFDYRNNEAIPKLMQQIAKWDRKYERVTKANRRPK